jgi:hypothetical protein
MNDRAVVLKNATLGGTLSGNRAGVKGTLKEHASVAPQSISTHAGASSGADLTVPGGSTQTLHPGSIGNVLVRSGATLRLAESGLYRFTSLAFEPDTHLSIQGNQQLTVLAVDGTLVFGDRLKMDSGGGARLAPPQVLFYAGGASVTVGFDTTLVGSIAAPAGTVSLQDRANFSGCVAGSSVTVGFDATVGDGAPAGVCDTANLVKNPGFESGTTGWSASVGATLTATSTRARSGTHSGSVGNRTAPAQGAVISLLSSAPRGATFDVSAWAEPSTSTSQPLILTAHVHCNGGQDQQIQLAQTSGRSTAWTRLAGTLVVPNCPLGALDLTMQGPAAGVGLFIDDVSVVQRCP